MADDVKQEAAAPAESGMDKSVRSIVIFSSVVLWLLAIFMINIMNNINSKLEEMNMKTESLISILGSQRSLESYQVTDGEGKVIYGFQIDPATMAGPEDMEGMGSMEGME